MENTYKIEWLEKIEKFGKPALKVSLSVAGATAHIPDVTIYKYDKENKEFPGFDTIMPGTEIFGRIYEKNGYKTLYPATKKAGNGGAFKAKQIDDTMNKKAEHIAHAQDEKAHAIKVASTFSAAKDAAIAEYQEQRRLSATGESLEVLFERWRQYFWLHFDVQDSDYPPTL